jgi:pimeloyl-ACP methyl ester carboxylesterase
MGADDRNGLPSFEERLHDAGDVRLRYFVAGAGSPLVLVHGLGGAASNWVLLAPLLAERFRVLVPELPGHGHSTALPAASTLDPYAGCLARLIEHERLERVAVVGHSLGGLVGLRLAVARPEQVGALVLAGGAGIRSATREAELLLGLAAFLRPSRAYSRFRRRVARNRALRYLVFGHWGASDPPALSPEAVEGLLAGLRLHVDTKTARRALVRDDPRTDLEHVRCPTLVLWGARDNQVPIDDAFQYARRLRAPLRAIADCGHLLIAERPDECADAIVEFLEAAPRQPSS